MVLFWVTIAGMGVIIVGIVGYVLFFLGWDDPPKILLPDSEILQPVLESPEGKAFIARYPDYVSNVYQDFYMIPCCSVDLVYIFDDDPQETAVILYANVSASPDLKTIAVDDDMRLACLIPEGGSSAGWTIKGDIVENLQPGKQDCWESPPPLPTDQELIEMASNTKVGKAYLTRYPENDAIIEGDPFDEGTKVRLTPKMSEPIEYVITVAGFDRVITDTYIVCSHGDYRYPDSLNFWSSFEPDDDCLQSVHDKLVVANGTEQAKAFQAKYPDVGLHKTDFSSRFTVTGTDSSIKYLYNDAILYVHFKPGSTQIANFVLQCIGVSSAGMPLRHFESGINLDVAKFLQDGSCPS
jgi:hypothetical protein